jgi:signal transduction histidine kinase/CheY-like chemotaxis protein
MVKTTDQSMRTVKVKVLEVQSNGLQVALLNEGGRGFIRTREVSWERRISVLLESPKVDQILNAVILEEQSRGNLLFLSLRKVTDPWAKVISEQKYKEKQIVIGEVVNVRHFAVFVQLEPGIDAILFSKDVPLLHNKGIEDVLSLGDKVSAEISVYNAETRQIELSLLRRLRRFEVSPEERAQGQALLFGAGKQETLPTFGAAPSTASPSPEVMKTPPQALSWLQRFLVVDDEPDWQQMIGGHLSRQYSVEIDYASKAQEAIEQINRGNPYSLIIIDKNLGKEDGVQAARQVRDILTDTPIILTSAVTLGDEAHRFELEGFTFSSKNLDELTQTVDDLRVGRQRPDQKSLSAKNNTVTRQIGLNISANRPLSEYLAEILAWLVEQTNVSNCMILEMDRSQRTISILASHPDLPADERAVSQDVLYYSPAKNVIIDEEEFFENYIDFERNPKYKYFFSTILYRSCLGLPIRIQGRLTRHALFLLDEAASGFDPEIDELGAQRIAYAQIASQFIAIALERAELAETKRKYEERYALGQLLGDLIHETTNKISGMSAGIAALRKQLTNRPDFTNPENAQAWIDNLDKKTHHIVKIHLELRDLVAAYARQASNEFEAVDVNAVVEGAAKQLAQTAKTTSAAIFLDLAQPIPEALAIRTHLQQIVLNLALNAIQMMDSQYEQMSTIAEQSGHHAPLLQSGVVIIQTRYHEDRPLTPIEIRVIDSGPGIHWHDQERIFIEGISTRGGQGLGLTISRNLAERMGGQLRLLDSILFLGSAFCIELSCYPNS